MPEFTAALIGNPNSGKTSIFNLLTKQNQRVANWPGMTVEKKSGTIDGISVIDLPGCYSLNNKSQLDEKITTDFLLESPPDLIVNVIHACKLSNHLYLTMQLIETNIPIIVVLNFTDQLPNKNDIDVQDLSQQLRCPVIAMSAREKTGIEQLVKHMKKPQAKKDFICYKLIDKNVNTMLAQLPNNLRKSWIAIQLLENNIALDKMPEQIKEALNIEQAIIADSFDEESEIIIADIRYNLIQKIINTCQKTEIQAKSKQSSYKIDKILLHPWLGLPVFLLIMYFMFAICLIFGSNIQAPFAAFCELWLVQAPLSLIKTFTPEWTLKILYEGLGTAITTTLSFIPPLFLLFSTLSLLEQSGYMARAAFITDKLMSLINLPGRAFVSLLIGFGCNVPAIMSTRTLQNQDDRILTAMMTPFMSCTARLALYVVLVQAFFKDNGCQVIFAIYSIGILAAIATGFIIKKVLLSQNSQPQILELPDYIIPSISQTWSETCNRIKRFIGRTLKFMIISCSILAILNTIPINSSSSILAKVAQHATILLQPIGIDTEGWATTVALIMGTIAKEVMIGIFYTLGNTSQEIQTISFSYLLNQSWDIWHNWLANIPNPSNTSLINLKHLFRDQNSVISFLLFSCLYLPCFSTLAALKKECGAKWGWLASAWSLILAYSTALIYFQWSNVQLHLLQTIIITISVICIIFVFIFILKINFHENKT